MLPTWVPELPITERPPVVLPSPLRDRLEAIIGEVLGTFRDPDFQARVRRFFADDPVAGPLFAGLGDGWAVRGGMGSFDFHIVAGEPRMIECSIFPAGMSFVADRLLDDAAAERYRALLGAVFAPFELVAICDERLSRQGFLREFFALKDRLEAEGKRVYICEAADVGYDAASGRILIGGALQADADGDLVYRAFSRPVAVEFVANRLTYGDLRNNPSAFAGLLAAQREAPERFLTDYPEWLVSEKSSLPLLAERPGLEAVMGRATLSGGYRTAAEVRAVYRQRLVAKPLFSRGGEGVLFRPSNPQLEAMLASGRCHVLQDLAPAPKLADGAKFDLRALLVGGEIGGYVARVFSGAVTNFRAPGSGHAPVVFE